MGEPLARPDLLTCSVGKERAAWVRSSGFALSKAVQRLIDAERGADREAERIALQTPETLASLDPTAKDPSDHLPEPPPVGAHGWTRQGARHIARPASLDELARLVSTAPGPVRLAASHVLIVAEVSDG